MSSRCVIPSLGSNTDQRIGASAPGTPVHSRPIWLQGLGTFGGVFTPSILTILGFIVCLRFGWVLGQAGPTGTLIIVTITTGITF